MAIVWTTSAQLDVNGIWDFIEVRNPDAAELVSSEILRTVEGLLQFPKRGKPGRVKETRELVISGLPYVAVYLLTKKNVVILQVLHLQTHYPIQPGYIYPRSTRACCEDFNKAVPKRADLKYRRSKTGQ
jgi:toxin ParE1/3/4